MPTSRKRGHTLRSSDQAVGKFASHRLAILIICLVALTGLTGAVIAVASGSVNVARGEGSSRNATAVESPQVKAAAPVRASGRGNPWINFKDGRDLRARYDAVAAQAPAEVERQLKQGWAQALSLASDDINLDGYPDLVCGYAGMNGGLLTLHLGNPEAFSPKKEETIRGIVNGLYPDPFLPEAAVLLTPEAPDYLAIGDFNRDSYPDIIAAARGGSSIQLLAGDEKHAFHSMKSLPFPGQITTMMAGEINYPDGLRDVAVGIVGEQGPAVMVFDGATGSLSGKAVSYPLRAMATAMAFGRLDDDPAMDLAVVAGGEIVIIHGQERRPSGRYEEGFEEVFGRMEPVKLPFAVKTIAVSDFIWDRDSRMEMAVLSEDGAVQILSRGELDSRPLTETEAREGRRLAAEAKERGFSGLTFRRAGKPLKWEVAERTHIIISKTGDLAQPLMMGTLASGQKSHDLLVLNPASRQLHIAMKEDSRPGRAESSALPVRRVVTFDADDEPVAALPMRLNAHGRPGVVVMRRGHVAPAFLMTASMATFMVTKTTDTNDGACNADCSLREAVVAANAAASLDMITFAATLNGSPIQLTIPGDDNLSAVGDLDINTDITIIGNGTANTIIQGSSNASFTGNMGDKIFGVNQAGLNPTLNASLSGLTVRFTRNDIAVNANFTQTGGAMDVFLTGTGAMPGPTTTVTNCAFDSNANLHSYGGAINVDSGSLVAPLTNVFRGTVQFTNTTISNNDTLTVSGADDPPSGGGVNLFADIDNVTFTNCAITGNQTSAIITANGGGVNMRHSNGGLVTLSNTTVSNNISGSDGGGILLAFNQNLTMTGGSITGNTAQGTGGNADGGGLFNGTNTLPSGDLTLMLSGVTISNNVATAGANARGGGLHNNANSPITLTNCVISGNSSDTGAGVANVADMVTINGTTPTGSSITGNTAGVSGGGVATLAASAVTNITNTTISGNSGPTSGGAFFVSGGTLAASLNRIVNNASPSGSGIAQTGGTASVENNWWQCDGFPNATGCQTGAGTFDADPRVDLKVTASPASVSIGGTSTITASFATNSNNVAINPIVMNGLPVTFSATNGSISPMMGTIASLTATSAFTNTACANGTASATVDNGTDSATITFNKANTTTTVTGDSPDPTVVGQPYTVTFTVTDGTSLTPTGAVTVSDGVNSCMGTVASGQCALTSLTAGAKTLVATYAGDACFNGSVSAGVSHTVNPANTTTTVTSSLNPSVFGQNVTFTATVTAQPPGGGTPAGNVQFVIDGGAPATVALNGSGQASLSTSSLTVGNHTVTVNYLGNANYNASSGSLAGGQTVNKANTVTTITADNPDPSVGGQSVTVMFTVVAQAPASGTPTGNVTVTVSGGGETCAGTVAAGQCSLTLTTAGARTITATYAGDANFNGSSDTEAHTVNKANTVTTITADNPDPSTVGQSVTVMFTVVAQAPASGTPTGNVTVTVSGGGETCAGTVAAGQCSLTLTTAGARTITATYAGDANFNGSSDTEAHTVNAANTTTTVTSSQNPSVFGQPVTFTATVSASPSPAIPTGTVVFTIDGNPSAPITLNASGQATLTTSSLSVSAHSVVAAYTSNDASFNNSSGSLTQTVNKANSTTTILTDDPDPSNVGQNIVVTYSVVAAPPGAGTPTGNVTVSDGVNSCVGTVTAGQCTVALTTSGARTLTATYAGDTNFNSSSDTEPHSVGSPLGPGAPFPATSEVSDQKAGSVLIYNIYTSNAASPDSQDTRINITNVDPSRPAIVKFFFVDGATCSAADQFLCLTPNQTASFQASDMDPNTTGYIVAVAVDSQGCPTNFNNLVGDAYVKFSSGHAANLGAEAIAAIAASSCNQNSDAAVLNFDGVSYNRIPRVLALDNIPSRADGNDTLLILNRIGGDLRSNALTLINLFGVFYDDVERGLSFTFNPGTCQFRASISNNFPRITPRFETFVPAGRSGWLKVYSGNDQGILGAAINFNPNAASAAEAFNQGHNLHKLTLTSSASYTIPVFPPNC